MSRPWRLALRPVLVVAASLSLAIMVVPAAAASPAISLSPRHGPPTQRIVVLGNGFGAAETVDVTFDGVAVGSARTDATGTFRTKFAAPQSALPGDHPVRATGLASGLRGRAEFVVRTDWLQFAFDAAHTGYNPFENVLNTSNVGGLRREWLQRGAADRDGSFAVWGGLLLSGDAAVNASDGAIVWERAGSMGTPAVSAGVMYTGGDRLYALNPGTGQKIWARDLGAGVSPPTVTAGVVYVGSGDDTYALSASGGTILWSAPYAGSELAVAGGSVFESDFSDVRSLDAATGQVQWSVAMEPVTYPVAAGGLVYVVHDGSLVALDAGSGAVVWTSAYLGLNDASPAVAYGMVFVSNDAGLCAFDAATGTPVWSHATMSMTFAAPVVANGVVYAVVGPRLYVFDASTGKRFFETALGGWIHVSPSVANGVVYVDSERALFAYGL